MGQYWIPVNLDKKEYFEPHALGVGLKLWEQLAGHPGSGAALIILLAAMPEQRGGGDFDLDENWHRPERTKEYHDSPGPMTEDYPAVAQRTIGRWAGDRIAFVGDYAEDSDLPEEFQAGSIYSRVRRGEFQDITQDVARVIEHELQGKFQGTGWRDFQYDQEGE